MIRTSKHKLWFCNKNKSEEITKLVSDYENLSKQMLDYFWKQINLNDPKSKKFASKEDLFNFKTNFSERLKQCCSKQVLSLITSAISKRQKQIFVLNKLKSEGKDYFHLQKIINETKIIKPNIGNINLELDSRFVDFEFNKKSFLCFVKLASLYKDRKNIKIPIGNNKVFEKWNKIGTLKKSIRLNKDNLNFYFEVKEVKKKTKGKVIGCDQGIKDLLTLSDGQNSKTVGLYQGRYDLSYINKKLSLKKKGSKSFKRCQEFRKNYINWYINKVNFSNIKELRLEKLKNVGKGKKKSRFLSHWTYRDINDKLYRLSEEKGFLIREVDNKFRSQRCSKCGYVNKRNRKGKVFKCLKCSYREDSDKNASKNISLDLYDLPNWVFLNKINLSGFIWKNDGLFNLDQERLVPDDKRG